MGSTLPRARSADASPVLPPGGRRPTSMSTAADPSPPETHDRMDHAPRDRTATDRPRIARTAIRTPLYDARFEHDACGVGFVADAGGHGRARVLPLALAGLARLAHRGRVRGGRGIERWRRCLVAARSVGPGAPGGRRGAGQARHRVPVPAARPCRGACRPSDGRAGLRRGGHAGRRVARGPVRRPCARSGGRRLAPDGRPGHRPSPDASPAPPPAIPDPSPTPTSSGGWSSPAARWSGSPARRVVARPSCGCPRRPA